MKETLPALEDLAGIGREQLWGLIEQGAGPTWADPYEYSWQRPARTMEAVLHALRRAQAGERTELPADRAPRFLLPAVRDQVTRLSQGGNQHGAFGEIRLLERLGLVDPDHDDAYVLAMIGGLGDRRGADDRAAALRAD